MKYDVQIEAPKNHHAIVIRHSSQKRKNINCARTVNPTPGWLADKLALEAFLRMAASGLLECSFISGILLHSYGKWSIEIV